MTIMAFVVGYLIGDQVARDAAEDEARAREQALRIKREDELIEQLLDAPTKERLITRETGVLLVSDESSDWLKDALLSAVHRDPEQAATDAERIAKVLRDRATKVAPPLSIWDQRGLIQDLLNMEHPERQRAARMVLLFVLISVIVSVLSWMLF